MFVDMTYFTPCEEHVQKQFSQYFTNDLEDIRGIGCYYSMKRCPEKAISYPWKRAIRPVHF